jgi:hypothetical protein
MIASDAHALTRPPSLRRALAALSAGGVREPERLAGALPRALLERGLTSSPAALAA